MRFLFKVAVAGCLALLLSLAGGVASAGWRDEVQKLRIGVLAGGDSAYRVATLEPFRIYLQDRTGIPVEIVPAASYRALIDAQTAGDVDYAIYSATSYATAFAECDCVTAIGAPIAADGALGFHSILVATANGGIESLADARGKRVALAGPDSVAGRLIPVQAFAAEDIVPEDYFSTVVTKQDPEAALAALLAGEVDVAVGWSSLTGPARTGYNFGSLARMVADERLTMDQIEIVWRSRLIPFGPHAVRSDMPPELRVLLSRALVNMATLDPEALDAVDRAGFGGGGFATPDASLYTVVTDLVAPGDGATQ
ncbi:phosphate/phosphite/phosphonate ABC transporter substrate-binding protein [Bauldia litoralis]|uniref:Phosphonate transport system substrate-binding protein n=1 Tax=Bauldia litoralis TaxID=665467 RepID=A0A1G6EFD4_9HYPH|nr:phosphate/phosphite/phosphonate ABC transporter substrate-binding protein [Bauldia litoralis]SDB56179.1 phosphonate transport system substrate-binding protein [Bauldia litoralis]